MFLGCLMIENEVNNDNDEPQFYESYEKPTEKI